MDQTKAWYQSSGVWGGIISAACLIVGGVAHLNVSAADQAALADALAGVGAAVGTIIGIYGRVTATKKVGPTS